MRFSYEYYSFYLRQLSVFLLDDGKAQVLSDVTRSFFTHFEIPKALREKIDGLLSPNGLSHKIVHAESFYHLQRFRAKEFFAKGAAAMWHVMDNLPENFYPLCFHCGIKVPTAKAKYCTKCGLWMW